MTNFRKKIFYIVGNRPQFIKLAPLLNEAKKNNKIDNFILHTGQHYDEGMSDIFFKEMKIENPDFHLKLKTTNHGSQTAEMLDGIEKILLKIKPDIVIVFGDTNSTLAGSLAASKLKIKICHIESGLRSYNKNMPEEINRIVTDAISDYLFCPTAKAIQNLKSEGKTLNVFLSGDIMLDSINFYIKYSKKPKINFNFRNKYNYLTLHRDYNSDKPERLKMIFNVLERINENYIFPVHPRTRKNIYEYKINIPSNIVLVNPVGYLQSIYLIKNAEKIYTDSGGIQKEAYFLKKPCITLRTETEWVETVETGWNLLINDLTDSDRIIKEIKEFNPPPKRYKSKIFGNGNTSRKILKSLGL